MLCQSLKIMKGPVTDLNALQFFLIDNIGGKIEIVVNCPRYKIVAKTLNDCVNLGQAFSS